MDCISKQKLNVMMLVDTSSSMRGERIRQVNTAIRDMQKYLTELEGENSAVDFYLTVITFDTEAQLLHGDRQKKIDDFTPTDIKAGGWSNLHLAYETLEGLLQKEKKGGIMPDYGGVAPILLLMTDGHPTEKTNGALARLQALPWFRAALKYGIAIELNDDRTLRCLRDFVSDNGDVVDCYDARLLEKIIKIIVLTASKVKSQSSSAHLGQVRETNQIAVQEIQTALLDTEDWEW